MSDSSTTPTLARRLARLLGGSGPAARRSGRLDIDLSEIVVDVDGVGRLGRAVPPAQSRALVALAEPAPFGLGTETLHDTRVRDTWQVPRDLVHVDWGRHLDAMLETAAAVLDLPLGRRLTADLHSMLVYDKGQFFAPHQDSEKDDDMVATLVVTLPSRHTGGQLVVHEADRQAAYRSSADEVDAVVLYADQVHEVKPVRSGYRISLTFNLMAVGAVSDPPPEGRVQEAALLLERYFARPLPRRWSGDDAKLPQRFTYLLDHEYTPAALSWRRLKGTDVEAARRLRAAVETLGGETVLALTDIHEIWDADTGGRGWGRYREDQPHVDDVDLGGLIEEEIVVTHWLLPGQPVARPVSLGLDPREVGAKTASVATKPYAAEYEGYMGNYGNTVDRWYHRAAVVVWPSRLAFVNRAEADTDLALEDLRRRAAAGGVEQASTDALTLEPIWPASVRTASDRTDLLGRTLALAALLDANAADVLLRPFAATDLTATHAAALATVAERHGAPWVVRQMERWPVEPRPGAGPTAEWMSGLPVLAAALRGQPAIARVLLDLVWSTLEARVGALARAQPTRSVVAQLTEVATPVAALLRAAALAGQADLCRRVVATVTAHAGLRSTATVMARLADDWDGDTRVTAGVVDVARYAVARLREELARPVRDPQDWSLTAPPGCGCRDCQTLAAFLADSREHVLAWPLAQHGRDHVAMRVRSAESPVAVRTIKQGRPYTLELTKKPAIFDQEAARRRQAEDDLVGVADLLASWA